MSVDNVQCPTPSNVSRFPRSLSPVNKSVQFTRTLKALKKSQFEKSTTSMINQCDQLNIFQFLISKKASFCVSHILIFYKSGEFTRTLKALKKSQFAGEKSTTSMINQCEQLNIFQFLITNESQRKPLSV